MIDTVFFDIDGVLTDGTVYIDSEGRETKRISFDDVDAVFELKRAGVRIGFITGEENGFSEYVKRRFAPDYFASGCKDKLGYFKGLEEREGLQRSGACFVGDSAKDVELLAYLEHSFAPSDVDDAIKRAAGFVTNARRGGGVIREVAGRVLGMNEGRGGGAAGGRAERRKGKKPKAGQKTVAIIPARGGSRGVPHKNVRLLVGRPLIHYAIEACLETPEVDMVVVSTDSEEVKEAASQFKEVRIIDRPPELAADDTTSEAVLLHAIGRLEKEGVDFDTVLFAQATSPLSEPSDFSALLAKKAEGFDSAAFCVDDYGFFFERGDTLEARLPRQKRTPRKREGGNAWAFDKAGFMGHGSRTFGNVGLCKIEPPKDLEIDTESDLVIVERLLQLRERRKRGLYARRREDAGGGDKGRFEAGYWGVVVDPDGRERDRALEREQRIEDVREELEHIGKLPPGRVLDVGCGMGELLSAMDGRWEKYGVEVSEVAAREAARHGDIFVGQLKDAAFEDGFFDLVVMHHVIEHLESPEDDIAIVRGLLRRGGRLIMATPDFDGAMARRYGERYRLLYDRTHVSLFSRVSLRHFLEDFGFEIEMESFPFFETRHFTKENMDRLFDAGGVSPPFWGSFMTFYCVKK